MMIFLVQLYSTLAGYKSVLYEYCDFFPSRCLNIMKINMFNTAYIFIYEPPHDKTNKMACAPSDDSLSAWRKHEFLATHWAHSEDFEQTGRMPRLIWVFTGRAFILLVLSCRGSYIVISRSCDRRIKQNSFARFVLVYFPCYMNQNYLHTALSTAPYMIYICYTDENKLNICHIMQKVVHKL